MNRLQRQIRRGGDISREKVDCCSFPHFQTWVLKRPELTTGSGLPVSQITEERRDAN